MSHLLSVLHQAGSTTLDGASYGYDYADNRTSKTNYLNGITSNYAYDAIYELQQVTQVGGTTESYSYDAVGNRLSSSGVPTYSYNPSNELTSTSSGSYTYDANGNTLSDPSGKSYILGLREPADAGRRARHWDHSLQATIRSAGASRNPVRLAPRTTSMTGMEPHRGTGFLANVLARYNQSRA